MATAAAQPHHVPTLKLDKLEHGILTVAIMMAVLLQVLDTTIANVALPHMMASMSATPDTITWVLTSYIVASAIAIPITGWLADRVGRRPLFIWSVVAFTVASALCAAAQNLPQIVVFRALQGVSGAFLVPIAQAILFDINPPARHARAMAMFGMGVMIGPILGPVLGGWLTDNYNWRWVFLVNVPVGAVCTLLLMRIMPATELRRRSFDLLGFAFLAVALGAPLDNRAKAGGALLGAVRAYLADPALDKAPPRVVLWEMPERILDEPLPAAEREWAQQLESSR